MLTARVKYVAEIDHVREVSLRCAADLKYWHSALRDEELAPAAIDGRAAVMVSATDARFRGVRFRELSISVLAREIASGVEGWFLAHAFNSSRIFALVERAWFSTPYYFGRIEVHAEVPAGATAYDGEAMLCAAMATDDWANRAAARCGEESWRGPIFLPTKDGRSGGRRKLFYAKLSGQAQAFSFLPGRDQFAITPSSQVLIFQQLIESNVAGVEWLVRPDASHAKSRTYNRPAETALA